MGASESQFESEPQERTRKKSCLLFLLGEAKRSKKNTKALDKTQSSEILMYDQLMDGDSTDNTSSISRKLLDRLRAGVFLDNQTKQYWVERKANCYCYSFLLYARALSIIWGDHPEYWKWVEHREARGTMIEVAELEEVCWLQVSVKFDTRKLLAGVLYKVCFIVRLKDSARGWENPVILELKLPGRKTQRLEEILMVKPKEAWIEILVGEFVAPEKHVGEMLISLSGSEGTLWKRGLIIKGVAIKLDIQNCCLAELEVGGKPLKVAMRIWLWMDIVDGTHHDRLYGIASLVSNVHLGSSSTMQLSSSNGAKSTHADPEMACLWKKLQDIKSQLA